MADSINHHLTATQHGDMWTITVNWTIKFVPLEEQHNFLFDTNWTLWDFDETSDDDHIKDSRVIQFKPNGQVFTNPDEATVRKDNRNIVISQPFTTNASELEDGDLFAVVHLRNADLQDAVKHFQTPRLNINL